jgi:electron transfer flavoprotein-quinone oxidoreductase
MSDVIIAGAGLSGLVTAKLLAKAGLTVTVFERAAEPGAKSGYRGLVRLDQISEIGSWDPSLGRVVTTIGGIRLDPEGSLESSGPDRSGILWQVDWQDVFRWLGDLASNAGAELVYGTSIERLVWEDGRISGVTTSGNERFLADCVVLADGAGSILAEDAGIRRQPAPAERALVAEEVIEVANESEIGSSFELFDRISPSIGGYGYLFVERERVTLGVGSTLDALTLSGVHINDMLDRIKRHPRISPLVGGGETVRYSARMMPLPPSKTGTAILDSGVMIVGDAAGLTKPAFGADLDPAIGSAEIAAKTILEAAQAGDFSIARLSRYRERLEDVGLFDLGPSPFVDERSYIRKQFDRLKHPAGG